MSIMRRKPCWPVSATGQWLYNTMQENRRKVDEEKAELQSLVSDISSDENSHRQLKNAQSYILDDPSRLEKRRKFSAGYRSELDKLDFLSGRW